MVESNARRFWTSRAAEGYPTLLKLKSGETCGPGVQQRQWIGNKMRGLGWIPAQGPILDVAAANCTKYILGDELAGNGRTWAVDFAQMLLEDGGVREDRRIVDDVTQMSFPVEWKNKFSLVYSSLFFRYLATPQRIELIKKIRPILAPGGRLVIVDFKKIQDAELAKELGEREAFSTKDTEKILRQNNLSQITSGTWYGIFYIGGDTATPFSVDYVSCVK